MNSNLLKKKRKELGLTQKQLSELTGISVNTIYNYETDKVEPIKKNLEILSQFFNISEMDLALKNYYNDNKKIDFQGIEDKLEIELTDLIASEIYRDINLKKEDIDYILERTFSIIKIMLNYDTIIYSSAIKKVVFHKVLEDKEYIKTCDLNLFISTIKNLLSIINNQIFDKRIEPAKYYYKILKNEYEILNNKEGGSDE